MRVAAVGPDSADRRVIADDVIGLEVIEDDLNHVRLARRAAGAEAAGDEAERNVESRSRVPGRLEVHPETIVLRPFVLNIASELESLVNERGLSFSIAVGASLPRVRTDPAHLRQILVNLIGNAVKYTPAGGVAIRARLVGAATHNALLARRHTPDDPFLAGQSPDPRRVWIALQVVDTGVGIAPANQARIFEEFEQVNAGPRGESMQRGTGLGLAISRRLACRIPRLPGEARNVCPRRTG